MNGVSIVREVDELQLPLLMSRGDLADLEAGELELNRAPTSLQALIDDISARIRGFARAKGLLFAVDRATPLPARVSIDKERFRQVLLILLHDAVAFTSRGRVTLRITANHGSTPDHNGKSGFTDQPAIAADALTVRFDVIGTGVVIADEQQGGFKPLVPVEDDDPQRAGLGSAITRRLVQLMGGELHVTRDLRRGSKFSFEVPLPLVSTEESDMSAAPKHIIGYQGQRRTILIADDEEPNIELLSRQLQPLGFEIVRASDGREAVAKAQEAVPDVIIMDLIMPIMTGFQAVKRIGRINQLRRVPILAMSASTLERDRVQARSVGCKGFLAKPIKLELLLSMLESHLTLSWEYQDPESSQDNAAAPPPTDTSDSDLVPPPQEELEVCYRLARIGSMLKLREQISHVRSLGAQYHPFADRLDHLARGFQDEELMSLLEQFYQP